jgi:hypothetical protein
MFAGASLGLLVGLLIGLSSSEVVGLVVGALTALLGAFFGLKDNPPEAGASARWRRIAAFGICCTAAVLTGLYLRANNSLGQSPARLARAWQAAGFAADDARLLAAYERLGVIRGDWRVQGAAGGATTAVTSLGILFSDEPASDCPQLAARRHADADARLRAFELAAEPWPAVARAAADLRGAELERALEAAWKRLCA